jgi:ZIP family zinc transporter
VGVLDAIRDLPPVLQVLLATGFTWGMTALGAGLVFFTKEVKRWMLDAMLGFAAGVMIAASYFSLLAPAVEFAEAGGTSPWIPAVVGFLGGGIFLRGIDRVLPHLHPRNPMQDAEGIKTSWHRSVLLVSAITLHNIPEGLAIGVAFGAVAAGIPGVPEASSLAAAVALAVGIGLQNFPEGTAVSMPLRREGVSPSKSFFYGQLSAVVEPVAGVLGVVAVTFAQPLLPYALAFAAGAMIFVVVEELIPESQKGGHTDLATMSLMVGFAVMMTLDVAFG